MKKIIIAFMVSVVCLSSLLVWASARYFRKAMVDFDAYEKLIAEVKQHRKDRLVNVEEFLRMSRDEKLIILDTRSDSMYRSKHIKGAVHLNFSDFTQDNLAKLIPDRQTKILIYCNNNFEGDQVNFASKIAMPMPAEKDKKSLTLALNIPTYINLYGYGYKNVYELSELVNVFDGRLQYEGLAMSRGLVPASRP